MGPCHSTCAASSGSRKTIPLGIVALLAAIVTTVAACRDDADEQTKPPAATTAAAAPAERRTQSVDRLRIDGTHFQTSDGGFFTWRGITAFRLVDYVADGESAKAEAFLTWAAGQRLNVVRVLTMMGGQFDLLPDDGRRALPQLLKMAAAKGIHVEVVALAGTADIPVDLDAHVEAIGRILADHPNGLLEIANEPVHPSQSAEVQRPEVLQRLAQRVPRDIPVSLGSIERGDGFGAGSYITWHVPRESGRGGWGHVFALAEGDSLLRRWKKPVVSDEPIGAGPELQPGRRDNVPARFRAAALLTRMVGMGATFHYEGGLQARVPEGRELESLNAWNEAWTLLPETIERDGTFVANAGAGSVVAAYDREKIAGVFERKSDTSGWVLVIGDEAVPLTLADGWTIAETRRIEGGRLLAITRLASRSRSGI